MKLLRRKPTSFEIHVQDMVLRITANEDFAEESALQHPEFRTSKRPLDPPAAEAPAIVQEMVASASAAGVGPMFTFQGAVVDQVGRFLIQSLGEVTVACGGDYFIKAKKRVKLAVKRHGGEPITVALEPDPNGVGVSTTLGRGRGGGGPDGLAVIADTCMAADAAAAGVQALLPKKLGFAQAVRYLKTVPGVRGGVFVMGERIGVAGNLEIAG